MAKRGLFSDVRRRLLRDVRLLGEQFSGMSSGDVVRRIRELASEGEKLCSKLESVEKDIANWQHGVVRLVNEAARGPSGRRVVSEVLDALFEGNKYAKEACDYAFNAVLRLERTVKCLNEAYESFGREWSI